MAFHVYMHCGFMPSIVWRLSNNISSNFRGRKLALKRENFLHYDIITCSPCIAINRHNLMSQKSFSPVQSNMASSGLRENVILTKVTLTKDGTNVCVKGEKW